MTTLTPPPASMPASVPKQCRQRRVAAGLDDHLAAGLECFDHRQVDQVLGLGGDG